jgi:phosphatidylserine/phosphatidylglycerophosphate/cardiolipin synthase-like enzyme
MTRLRPARRGAARRRAGRRAAGAAVTLVIVAAVAAALLSTWHRPPPTPAGRPARPSPAAHPTTTRQARKTRRAGWSHVDATSTSRPARVRAAGALSLVVEPDAGPEPVYALLRSARRSVEVEIYELEDDQATALLAADAARGVRVRVLLDGHYVRRYNAPAFSYLQSHGVRVRWAPAQFDVAHEKAIVVDRRRAAIMTMNLTARYYASSRDFVVIDRDRADVAAVEATFNNDWTNGGLPPASPADLVWSPGAQDALVALIASSHRELLVENEEMNDEVVVRALQAAARRGVRVEVVMTRQSDWASAFSALARTGVAARTYSASAPLYIHAKAIVVDPGAPRARVFLGSQNFSVASLLYDRELGVVSTRPALIAEVAAIIRRDGSGATAWQP